MSPSVIGTAYIRNLYRRIYPQDIPTETAQVEMAPVLLVGRMSVPAALDKKFNDAYNNERLPLCRRIPGYIRARRFAGVTGESGTSQCIVCNIHRNLPESSEGALDAR